MTLQSQLEQAGTHTQAIANRWAPSLTTEDRDTLVQAFHRAESLAEAALVQAIAQVPDEYIQLLNEQLEDERRHVAVFAGWQEDPMPIRAPKAKQRSCPVWFSMLLVNEVAGFCQFHMLQGLVGDPAREAQVAAIARDEIRHISRLVEWLAPFRNTKAITEIETIIESFQSRLGGRMKQFLPRDELSPLRTEMADAINALLSEMFEDRP